MKTDPRYCSVSILDRYVPARVNLSALIKSELDKHVDMPEKGFAREIVWGTVRNLSLIDHYIDSLVKDPRGLEPRVRNIIRIGLCQLFFMEGRVPEYAAVNESVGLAGRFGRPGAKGLVNAVLRRCQREKQRLDDGISAMDPVKRISLRYSYPEWLAGRWVGRYGEASAERLCRSGNEVPPLVIRVNTLNVSRGELVKRLSLEGVNASLTEYSSEGLSLETNPEFGTLETYRDGMFVVQDEASQLVSSILGPKKGEKVLDLCCGAGIKALHMAQLAGSGNGIRALDISEDQLKKASENAGRLKIRGIEFIKADLLADELPPSDKILLDAPCSGLGALRRKPDIKWNRTQDEIQNIMPERQAALLEKAASALLPGGTLVYSTCTVEPCENSEVVGSFLRSHEGFRAEKIVPEGLPEGSITQEGFFQSLPSEHGMDGFFAAKIVRV